MFIRAFCLDKTQIRHYNVYVKTIKRKEEITMAEEKALLEGKYLMYKGKPLVREKNVIVYGDMEDKFYLFLMILTEKDVNGEKIPDSILIQVLGTDNKIIKQGQKNGLYNAFDIGTIWLERAIADSKK